MISSRLAGRIVVVAVLAGGAALWLSPETRTALAPLIGMAKGVPAKQAEREGEHGPPGAIKLTADQITKARIDLAPVAGCAITQQVTAPGAVSPDADRIGRVAAKVVGTVAELRKRLGDSAVKGEVIAVLES